MIHSSTMYLTSRPAPTLDVVTSVLAPPATPRELYVYLPCGRVFPRHSPGALCLLTLWTSLSPPLPGCSMSTYPVDESSPATPRELYVYSPCGRVFPCHSPGALCLLTLWTSLPPPLPGSSMSTYPVDESFPGLPGCSMSTYPVDESSPATPRELYVYYPVDESFPATPRVLYVYSPCGRVFPRHSPGALCLLTLWTSLPSPLPGSSMSTYPVDESFPATPRELYVYLPCGRVFPRHSPGALCLLTLWTSLPPSLPGSSMSTYPVDEAVSNRRKLWLRSCLSAM